MTIREIADQEIWESFVLAQQPNTFLHSWEWGEVQQASGEGIQRLGVYQDQILRAVALVILVKAKRGFHYLIPHGPITASDVATGDVLGVVVHYLKQRAVKDQAVALKIAPLLAASATNEKYFRNLKFLPAPLHVHAELTWVVDISGSSDEILQAMRKTTRHAIRKAEKVGVVTEVIADSTVLDRFWPLYEQTKQRHGFVPWSHKTLNDQLRIFGEHGRIFTIIGQYNGEDVAAALCPVYGKIAFYYHGASKKLPGSVPAAQLVQWAAMQEAKRRGCTRYNFWGIAPERGQEASRNTEYIVGMFRRPHPFAGITTFKRGFGGEAINYLHAQELPLSLWYVKLWLVDLYRRLRRGF